MRLAVTASTHVAKKNGTKTRTYTLAYDNGGRRSSLKIPIATNNKYVTSSYGYDLANHLTSLLQQGPSAQIENLTYTLDDNGNRNSFTRNATQTLSPAISNTSHDAANEMLALGTKNLTYDLNGNLQAKTDASGTTTYIWDARNRLTAISGPSLSASFSYDAINRRTSKTINGTTTQYVYDKWDVIQEIKAVVKTNYIRTLNIDEPLTRTNGTTTRHYVRDGLGSIIALADDTGAVKTTYVYDAFGNATASGETSDNPFQFTGRENDGTGLLHYRFRYYSPEMQRFISEDPIRLRGGGLNYYNYVQNNPIRYTDPYGLFGWDTVFKFLAKRAAKSLTNKLLGDGLDEGADLETQRLVDMGILKLKDPPPLPPGWEVDPDTGLLKRPNKPVCSNSK